MVAKKEVSWSSIAAFCTFRESIKAPSLKVFDCERSERLGPKPQILISRALHGTVPKASKSAHHWNTMFGLCDENARLYCVHSSAATNTHLKI